MRPAEWRHTQRTPNRTLVPRGTPGQVQGGVREPAPALPARLPQSWPPLRGCLRSLVSVPLRASARQRREDAETRGHGAKRWEQCTSPRRLPRAHLVFGHALSDQVLGVSGEGRPGCRFAAYPDFCASLVQLEFMWSLGQSPLKVPVIQGLLVEDDC